MQLNFTDDGNYNINASKDELLQFLNLLNNHTVSSTPSTTYVPEPLITPTSALESPTTNIISKTPDTLSVSGVEENTCEPTPLRTISHYGRKPLGKEVDVLPDNYYTIAELCRKFGLNANYQPSLKPILTRLKSPYITYRGHQYFDYNSAIRNILQNPQNTLAKQAILKMQNQNMTYDDSLKLWKRKQYEKIREYNLDVGKTCSQVFTRMTNIYGINWAQVSKDYSNYHQQKAKNVIELAYFLEHEFKNGVNGKEHYDNLFENCLDAVLKEISTPTR